MEEVIKMPIGGICPEGLNVLHLGMLEETTDPQPLPSCLSPLPANGSNPLDLPAELVM